jgi:hypothetical protein
MIGNIPAKLVYISRSPTKISWEWDDFEHVHKPVGIDVIPIFVADASKPKTIETGRSWASGYYNQKKSPIAEIEVDNTPFNIKIISLEKRDQGGRAYKVIFGDKDYYVDLREDVLLDTIIESGIKPGGVPNAQFIWGKVGSQMKLVRVNSDLHKQLIQATDDGVKPKLSKKGLDVGGVYKNKKGELFVYVGTFPTLVYDTVEDRGSIFRGRSTTYINPRFEKKQVWYEIKSYIAKRGPLNQSMLDEWHYFAMDSVNSKTVIEKVEQFTIDPSWRDKVFASFKDSVTRSTFSNSRPYEPRLGDGMYYAKYVPMDTETLYPDPFFDLVRKEFPNIK